VAYRLGEPARRPRGVLEDGEVVGACRRGVARALTGEPPEEPVVDRNHADAWEEPLPALGVAPDEQQARPAVVHAKPHAVGAEQREERDRDRTAFQDPEYGAVEGDRGIEHHGDAVALRDAVGLEEVGEARGPVGERLEAPLLGTAVGVLQAERRSPPDPTVHALVGKVEPFGIALEEVPERAPAEGLTRLRVALDVEDTRHGSVVTSRFPGARSRRRASRRA